MAAPYTMGEATFFAFQKREGGPVLLGAAVVYLVAMAVLYAGWIVLNFGGVKAYVDLVRSMAGGVEPGPSEILPAVMGMMGGLLLLIPLVGLLHATFEAACLKRMIRGTAGAGVFGINFGADAWRVFGCYLCWLMVVIGGYIGVFLIVAVTTLAGAATKSEAITGIATLISLVVACALWVFVSVRLAPGAAVSIQRGKFSFFDAWGVTRGRFWTLFGSFAFLWVIYIVAFAVLEGVAFFTVLKPFVAAMPLPGAGAPVSPEQMQAVWKSFATPTSFAALGGVYLVVLVMVMMFSVAGFGINARAALGGAEEAPAA